MTPDRMAEIEAAWVGWRTLASLMWHGKEQKVYFRKEHMGAFKVEATATAIAASPEDIPELLAHIRELEAANAALREVCEEVLIEVTCSCDDAYTERRMHAPNSLCWLEGDLRAALASHRNSADGDGGAS